MEASDHTLCKSWLAVLKVSVPQCPRMACVTLKRSLDFDPFGSPGRSPKRRRCVPLTVTPTASSEPKPKHTPFQAVTPKVSAGKWIMYIIVVIVNKVCYAYLAFIAGYLLCSPDRHCCEHVFQPACIGNRYLCYVAH